MNDVELRTMIILIEGEYPPVERNMPGKMVALLHKEFGVTISEQQVLNFYGITYEDYEREERRYEYRY